VNESTLERTLDRHLDDPLKRLKISPGIKDSTQ